MRTNRLRRRRRCSSHDLESSDQGLNTTVSLALTRRAMVGVRRIRKKRGRVECALRGLERRRISPIHPSKMSYGLALAEDLWRPLRDRSRRAIGARNRYETSLEHGLLDAAVRQPESFLTDRSDIRR